MPGHAHSPKARVQESERRFIIYSGLVGAVACLILVREILDRAGLLAGPFDRFSSEIEIVLEFLLVLLIGAASPVFIRDMRLRRTTMMNASQARDQSKLLFNMTDTLQSALGHADGNAVLRSTAASLLSGFGGALYIFNNSGDRLELSTSWDWPDSVPLSETISPSDCWAIKRGKRHLNLKEQGALCCDHYCEGIAMMEIPMMARGEVFGLLMVEREGDFAAEELLETADLAEALADAMSLSLSNLALRERLRTQALRDALTGLYNRRYMEDALERYADQAQRTRSPLSIVMIDLDHFKKLNDEHGHAMGDAVLSDVASAILGGIRPCDIACRYGGEELVVLLPDCTLEEAEGRAEILRGRIEKLSERHGFAISGSFGVSSITATSKPNEALTDADRALYSAKQQGRNRVATAPRNIREVAVADANAA